jgi:hypothetical protein
MRSKIILFGLLAVAGIAVVLFSCKTRIAQCPLCQRDIHEHMQVSITHNSIPLKTCCMSCALTFQIQEKNVEIKSATNFLTGTPIDPKVAFYVVGSDISPCTQDPKVNTVIREPHSAMYACYDRCEPGILAFAKESEAEAFQKEHGGHLEIFDRLTDWIPAKGGMSHD